MSKPLDEAYINTVKFSEPPRRTMYDWPAIAKKLRRKPMTWALVFEHDRGSIVNAIRQGGIVSLRKAKGFEVMTRNNKRVQVDGREVRFCDLYLRYNPDRDEEE